MTITRRDMLVLSAGAAAAMALPLHAFAGGEEAAAAIAEFTGGAEPQAGRVALSAPEVAENGNAVSITVSVDSAMEGDDLVEAVLVVADGNPLPDVARFHFTALSGAAAATTRIRLARSQTVTAIARMADGSFHIDRAEISVTVGGCTG